MERPCESYRNKEDVVVDGILYEKVTNTHVKYLPKIIKPTLFSVASRVPPKWNRYHPVSSEQEAVYGFKVGSVHKMRITQTDGSYSFIHVKIQKKCEYVSAKDLFGPYNNTDSFMWQKFTKALELIEL
jgi:hypothetical protein